MRKVRVRPRTRWVVLIALSLSLGGCITASVMLATAVVCQSIMDADIK